MKLSFVIPAFNEEEYIGDCLESIFRETKEKKYDIEIIVVNNASTDRTREVAASFVGVKVIDEPQKGLVRARQTGYLASRGDLIANIDADTMLTRGWLNKVYSEFYQDNELLALSGPPIYYDLPKVQQFLINSYYYLGYLIYLINRFVLRTGSMTQGGNCVIRRTALEKIGGYNSRIDFWGEDTDLAKRLNKIGKVKFTFRLPIYTSGRRLKAEGLIRMGIRYPLNYFSVVYFKRPFSKIVKDYR